MPYVSLDGFVGLASMTLRPDASMAVTFSGCPGCLAMFAGVSKGTGLGARIESYAVVLEDR